MLLSNVNIGSGPSAGDGAPLRSAFATINNNFAIVQSNVNVLTNSVTSVAGRTGNITLTVSDIIGFNSVGFSGTVPTSNSSAGTKGQMVASGNYLYICTAANTWIRLNTTTSF